MSAARPFGAPPPHPHSHCAGCKATEGVLLTHSCVKDPAQNTGAWPGAGDTDTRTGITCSDADVTQVVCRCQTQSDYSRYLRLAWQACEICGFIGFWEWVKTVYFSDPSSFSSKLNSPPRLCKWAVLWDVQLVVFLQSRTAHLCSSAAHGRGSYPKVFYQTKPRFSCETEETFLPRN